MERRDWGPGGLKQGRTKMAKYRCAERHEYDLRRRFGGGVFVGVCQPSKRRVFTRFSSGGCFCVLLSARYPRIVSPQTKAGGRSAARVVRFEICYS
jgi:hypothetical protein